MKIAPTAATAASLLLLALAPGPAVAGPEATKTPRQCFSAHSIANYAAVDDRTVNLRVGVKDVYQLQLLGACPEIDWSHQIAVQSRGTSRICSGLDATIIAPSSIGPRRCAVKTVRKLAPAEIDGLPAKQRP